MKQTKPHYLLLIIALTLVSCAKQKQPNFSQIWDFENIDDFFMVIDRKVKGDVMTYTDKTFSAITEDGEPAKDLMLYFHKKFDKGGNLIEDFRYDQDGVREHAVYIQYDKRGNIIERVKESGNYPSTMKYEYDNKGIISKRTIYSYDADSTVILYSYDDKSSVLQGDVYEDGGKMHAKLYFRFDEYGNLVSYESGEPNGEPEVNHKFEFDSKGLLLRLKDSLYGDEFSFVYDDKGNVTELLVDGESQVTMEYEYDKKGNWVKRNFIEGGVLMGISEREYEYY